MNDCSKADIRDRLPDLLHERLPASVRAAVMEHIADCGDCREELDLLRGVHAVLMTNAPVVDVGYVVNALPKPHRRVMPAAPRHRTRIDWRIAAAVTFLAVSGGSIAVMNWATDVPRRVAVDPIPLAVPDRSKQAAPAAEIGLAPAARLGGQSGHRGNPAFPLRGNERAASFDAQAAADVAPGGRLANLNEQQLKKLLGEIGHLPAVPVTESDPVAIGVTTNTSSSPEGA